jgi:hypothetical protein
MDNNVIDESKFVEMNLPIKCKSIIKEEECLSRVDCLFNKSNKCQQKPLTTKRKDIKNKEEEQPQIIKPDDVIEIIPVKKNKTKKRKDIKNKEEEQPQLIKPDDVIGIIPVKKNKTKKRKDIKNKEEEQPQIIKPDDVIGLDTLSSLSSIKSKILDKSACDKLDNLRLELNTIRKRYDTQIRECEEILFGEFITKYFNKGEDKLTHKDLLVGLQKFYITEKTKDVNFILSIQDFIQKFSQKTPVKGSNYKRQHIFEALCRLLVYFNYDKDDKGYSILGNNKQFYNSLEGFISGSKNNIDDDILDTKINEGSRAGIVDIFFKSKKNTKDNDKLWACELPLIESKVDEEPNEYIMIQNKYYDVEKSNISNYDVTRIYALASLTNKENSKFDGPVKIVLMVNNEDAVSNNLRKAKQQYPGLLNDKNGIIGVVSLNYWFQTLLYDLLQKETITLFLKSMSSSSQKIRNLQLRFHQKYIVKCSQLFIENGTDKFIWGAVPRSGKSYMIGGLISERFEKGITNNIVIILGALTETLQQFKDMFKDFSNFDKYTIITSDSKVKEGNLNIYLISQEWLKEKVSITKINNKIVSEQATFNDKMKDEYPQLFIKGKIDLYFDEVHKGGSTDRSESIIYSFNNSNVKIDIFIMVTATFAKPTLRYNNLNFIGSGSQYTEIIEWSYNDQQNMKELTDETKKSMMVNSRQGKQQDVLNNIFRFYQEYYGEDYLNALSNEYKKHPELVLISPLSINIQSTLDMPVPTTDDIRHVFLNNLKCSACEPSKEIAFYKNPANIFNQMRPVDDLLNFISHHIYNYFKDELQYPIDNTHTELWFLPDKHLYGTDSECKDICRPIDIDNANMDEDESNKKGIPNIEPLTRGLAIKICSHKGFEKYNVLIVHNTKLTYLGENIKQFSIIFGDFKDEKGNKRIEVYVKNKGSSLADQIKEFERDSYKNGKSLIVLTGAKLRLGISLPCADIAFNFDDIKSIDNNYQTMFRVLTEREKPELKKYGYYLDFNKDRAVQFIYEYNKIYGEAKKMNSKDALESLQSLLFTFNYNGLNLIKANTNVELSLYNHLISDLNLNEEGYSKFWSKKQNIVSLIKKSLASSGNMLILQELKRYMSGTTIKQKKTDESHKLKEGHARPKLQKRLNPDGTNVEEEEKEEEKEEEERDILEEDYGELINSISEELPSIIVLLAMFSDECSSIDECLQFSLKNISQLEKQCNCENIDESNILDCFFNSPGLINNEYKYNKEKLSKIIQLILNLINSEDAGIININLNFIFDNIKKQMTKSDGIIHAMTDKDIEEKIEQYLSVREDEKNKHGEVFTPTQLIDEILNKLPPSVWSNPNLKWLDPANGIGNFPMVAYQKLLKGLEQWEPNKNKRSKHIIENMLFMVEINPKNIKISKKIFGSNSNICCADFLKDSEKCFKQFGVENFDIVMGNPPFQKEQEGKREGGYGGRTLWDKFIVKSIELLTPNGYLCFITPPGWRKPEHELFNLMTKDNQLLYLHIISKKQGQQLFDVSQRIDLYVIQKHIPTKDTEIIDELDNKIELDVTKWMFLPNYDFENIKKIMTNGTNGIDIIYSRTIYGTDKNNMKAKPTEKYKYPIVHSINQKGLVFWYTDDKTKGHFGVSKVLLNFNEQQYPVNDFEGKYGMSQITFGIPITSKKQGDDIVKAINTDAFKNIIKATKWGAFQTDWRMFKYFKPDFYKQFLKDKQSTKIQSLTRGHQQRNKTKKIKSGIVKIQAITRGHQQRKKTKNQNNKKGGKKKTLKNSSIFKFWE